MYKHIKNEKKNEKKNDNNIIENDKDYIDKCNKYLYSTGVYNKQEFTIALKIYIMKINIISF